MKEEDILVEDEKGDNTSIPTMEWLDQEGTDLLELNQEFNTEGPEQTQCHSVVGEDLREGEEEVIEVWE